MRGWRARGPGLWVAPRTTSVFARPRAEYHPEMLTEPRRPGDAKTIDVEMRSVVLYDAHEQPMRREAGFKVTR